MHEIASLDMSVDLKFSHYMWSLKIWATSCANTYPEENNLLLTASATMQHSCFLNTWAQAKAADLPHQVCRDCSTLESTYKQSPFSLFILISMKAGCSNVACVPKYSHIVAFCLNDSVAPGVSNVSLFGISHWINVTTHNEFRHWNCIIKSNCIGNVC